MTETPLTDAIKDSLHEETIVDDQTITFFDAMQITLAELAATGDK